MQDWPPALVLELIEWLPDDGPYAAAQQGGREFLGWGRTRQMAADLWDLTVAIGMAGGKRKPPQYPRPAKRENRRTWRTLINEVREAQRRAK